MQGLKQLSYFLLLFLPTFCPSKSNILPAQCFITLTEVGPLAKYKPPLVISNYQIPDSLLPYLWNPIYVSVEEYKVIQEIIRSESNIKPDKFGETYYGYGSSAIFENCGSPNAIVSAYNGPQESEKHLNTLIKLMRRKKIKEEIISHFINFKIKL